MPTEKKEIEKQVKCYKCSNIWIVRLNADELVSSFAIKDQPEKTETFIKECPSCHSYNAIKVSKAELLG